MGIVYLEYRADTEPLAIVKRPRVKNQLPVLRYRELGPKFGEGLWTQNMSEYTSKSIARHLIERFSVRKVTIMV